MTKHTPFRLALELERLQRKAAEWLDKKIIGDSLDDLDQHIAEISRATRRTESYLRKRG